MFYDSVRDPVDNTVSYYYHWKSYFSTGASTTIFPDLFISSSPNFPPMSTGSPIRYMINLPGQPYYDGVVAGTHPMLVKNVNSSTILTRVAYNGTLTANTYKIFPATAETPARMEFHIGIGSNSAGDKIAFDGYFINNILSSDKIKNGSFSYCIASLDSSVSNKAGADLIIDTSDDAGVYINSIITTINAFGGGEIHCYPGTYNISTNILPLSNVNISGEGISTIFKRNSSALTQVIYVANTVSNVTMRDFYVDGNGEIYPYNGGIAYGICGQDNTNRGVRYYNIQSSYNYTSGNDTSAYGFYNITNFVNCKASYNKGKFNSIVAVGVGFKFCINGLSSIAEYNSTIGGTGAAIGFEECIGVDLCLSNNNTSSSGYGFFECRRMQGNTGTGNTTALLSGCYFSSDTSVAAAAGNGNA